MVSPWRSQEQRKRETIGGNDWCRIFSDLLAGDCTPILFLGKTETTFNAKSGYQNT